MPDAAFGLEKYFPADYPLFSKKFLGASRPGNQQMEATRCQSIP
jgi:hypothetical protein